MEPNKVNQAIETAKEIAKRYNKDTLIPFPFGDMSRELGDLEILYDDIKRDISGAIVYDETSKKYKILVNSSESPERQYFTLAHEVGHYFLHKEYLQNPESRSLVDTLENYGNAMFRSMGPMDEEARSREREANHFAAELIMPENKVREAWDITRGTFSIEYYAKMFSVSVSAMAIRIENLGLKKRGR